MPQVRISELGRVGVINDVPRWAIPDNALSDCLNIRAYHGRLRNFGGRVLVTTAPVEPYGLIAFQTSDRKTLWIEAGLNQVYVYDGTAHSDITRLSGPYTMDEYFDRWTGGIQGTLGFLCNGYADGPQQWTTISETTKLIDMMYDPQAVAGSQTWVELGYRAYSMRPFKNTILALNLRRNTLALPATVQWCDFIAPGATQTDWVARTTNSAREVNLGETSGNIIDGAELRDDFIIYKEDAAYRMSESGDQNNPFTFDRLPEYVRIINRNCIGAASEFHILASRDDVVIFDGNNFRSLLTDRLREYYTSRMDAERLFTTFVSVLNKESEVWICFPTAGQAGSTKFPDLAIVWSYDHDTLSLTDLPETRDLDEGTIVPNIPDTFDDTVPTDLTFDEDQSRFDQTPFQTSLNFMIGAHGTSVSTFGENPTDNGTPRTCLAERLGLVLADEKSGIRSTERVFRVRAIWPYLQSTGPVQVQVGAQESPGGPVSWQPEQTFDPSTQSHIDVRAQGKYFGYRIRSNADVQWDLTDVEFEYELSHAR